MFKKLGISIFICSFSFVLNAQMEEYVKFKNYSTEDFGLEQMSGLCWDSDGGFWTFSEEGLVHHNGLYKELYGYNRQGGNHPISDKVVGFQTIASNDLWFSYRDTSVLTKVNTLTKEFSHYNITELNNDSTLEALIVRVKEAPSGQLWLCTWGKGLIKFFPDDQTKNKTYVFGDSSVHAEAGLFIKDIAFMSKDSIFVTFFNGRAKDQSYPGFFNTLTEEFNFIDVPSLVAHLPDNQASNAKVACRIIHFVHYDDEGNFWLGSYSGLLHYDRKKNQLNRVLEKGEDPELQNQVNTLNYIESKGELWIATFNKGVMRVNIKKRSNNFYYTDPINSESIQNNKIKGISKDPFENVWVLNGSAGISVYNPYIHNFKMMYWRDMELEYSNRSNQNIPVNQLYVQSSSEVYVSSRVGLTAYNSMEMTVTNSYTFNTIAKEHGRLRGVQHFKILKDKIFLNNDTYPHFFYPDQNKVVRHSKEYGMGKIAFRHDPNYQGIMYFRSHKNSGTQFLDYSEGFESPPISWKLPLHIVLSETFSFVTNSGNWIFSEEGGRFVICNPKDSTFQLYSPSSSTYFFPDSTVRSCLILEGDEILIGTQSALYRFHESSGEFENISQEVGLKEEEGVNSMVEDDDGKIWMALKRELLCWDPNSGEHLRYGKNFGVDASDFLPAIGQKDELGNLYFASMYGILFFHPHDVRIPDEKLETSLYQVKVNEKVLSADESADLLSGKMAFNWSENFLEFYFHTNQVLEIAPHTYYYKLDGLNDKWINCGTGNHVRFDNLQDGDYTLNFKAKNAFGVESNVVQIPFSIKKPYWKTWWFILVCIFASGLLVYALVRQRMRALKKRSELLEETVKERTAEVVEQKQEADRQREMVEEKQQEITDSITYAKRIQDAILPSEELINLHLPQSFIMYRPKDIVAGDFYWMEPLGKEQFIIAAADCTGHGVPGAMVSVVCNNALNRSVREFKISDTGKILDSTKDLVVEQFEKNAANASTDRDETIKDGMDISICKVDKKNKNILWTGANNPLWIIRNNELIEIKGNKQPVGKFDPSTNFTTHEVKVESDDIFYIFSDGYADQFGGEKGKKFKSSSLKKLLLSIHKLSLSEQLEKLEKQFDDWKGDYEQLDDVCVIGFKID